MSPEQVAQLESRFNLTFPPEYRDVLLNYPFSENRQEITADLQTLMTENEGPRVPEAYGFPWADGLWWIGDDGAGGFYFIDCTEIPTRVYYWDPEDETVDFANRETLSPRSIREAVEGIRQADRDDAEWRQHRLQQITNRRWWQFWIPKRPPAWLLK